MLSEARVQEAKELLLTGRKNYPDDKEIEQLLVAVIPGKVSTINRVSKKRNREMEWIKKYGQEYRGKWVAIQDNKLLASSDNLKSLIIKVNQLKQLNSRPFIQRIV